MIFPLSFQQPLLEAGTSCQSFYSDCFISVCELLLHEDEETDRRQLFGLTHDSQTYTHTPTTESVCVSTSQWLTADREEHSESCVDLKWQPCWFWSGYQAWWWWWWGVVMVSGFYLRFLGCLSGNQVREETFNRIIWSNNSDLQMKKRKKSWSEIEQLKYKRNRVCVYDY